MIFLFFFLLGLVFIFNLKRRELIKPENLFIVPFVFCVFIAAINSVKWHLSNNFNTIFIIGMGAFCFGLVSQFFSRIKYKKKIDFQNDERIIDIATWKCRLFLIVEVCVYLYYAYAIYRYGASHGVSGLFAANAYAARVYKSLEVTEDLIELPFVIDRGIRLCSTLGYFWAYILSKNLAYKNNRLSKYYTINFVICILGSLIGGSRGTSVELIIAFVVMYLFFFYKSRQWRVKIDRKLKVKIFWGIGITFVLFFLSSAITKNEMTTLDIIVDTISAYIGAQVKNLDIFLNANTMMAKSEIMGQATFENLYKFIGRITGNTTLMNVSTPIPFQFLRGNIGLGNVYTCYYQYILDYGKVGFLFPVCLMACISSVTYQLAKRNRKIINKPLIVYSFMSSRIVFSFFSERFFNRVVHISSIEMMFWLYIIIAFCFNTKRNNIEV